MSRHVQHSREIEEDKLVEFIMTSFVTEDDYPFTDFDKDDSNSCFACDYSYRKAFTVATVFPTVVGVSKILRSNSHPGESR